MSRPSPGTTTLFLVELLVQPVLGPESRYTRQTRHRSISMKQLDPKQRWVGKFTLGKNEAIGDLAYDPEKGITLEARVWPPPKGDPPFMAYPRISGHVGGDRPCTLF